MSTPGTDAISSMFSIHEAVSTCNATITFRHVPFPNADLRGYMETMAKRIGFPQQAISHD